MESESARRQRQEHERAYERALRESPAEAQHLLDRFWAETRRMRAGVNAEYHAAERRLRGKGPHA
jgi:hypothetical protein